MLEFKRYEKKSVCKFDFIFDNFLDDWCNCLGSWKKRSAQTPTSNSQKVEGVSTPSNPENSDNKNEEMVFYYGNTCPHCKDVENWMEENKIEEKLKIVKKEVYDNKANASELFSVAKKCGINSSSIGVPFLYTQEGKCLIGTPDVTNYLKEKAGL